MTDLSTITRAITVSHAGAMDSPVEAEPWELGHGCVLLDHNRQQRMLHPVCLNKGAAYGKRGVGTPDPCRDLKITH